MGLDNLLSNMEVIFGIHMNKAIPKSLVVQVLNRRHKDLKYLHSFRPHSAPFSGILPSQCCMLECMKPFPSSSTQNFEKVKKVKNPQISPKPPKPITKQPPPKNSNQTNFHLVLSLESRSSQPFPNRSLGKFPHTPHPHLRPSMMARRCRAIPSPCSCAASAWVSAAFTTWRLRRLTPGARKDAGRTHVMSCEIFVNLEHVCRYMFVSYILIYNYIHTLCKIPFYKHRFPQKKWV